EAGARRLGVIREALEEAAPERGGPRVVARARGLVGGQEKSGRGGAALWHGVSGLLRDGPRGRDVAEAGEAVRLLEQRVLRDGRGDRAHLAELMRGLGPVTPTIEGQGDRETLPGLRSRADGGTPGR